MFLIVIIIIIIIHKIIIEAVYSKSASSVQSKVLGPNLDTLFNRKINENNKSALTFLHSLIEYWMSYFRKSTICLRSGLDFLSQSLGEEPQMRLFLRGLSIHTDFRVPSCLKWL